MNTPIKGLIAVLCKCKAFFQLEKHIKLLYESFYIAHTLILQKTETEAINVHIPHLDTFKSNSCTQVFLSKLCLCKKLSGRLNEIKHVDHLAKAWQAISTQHCTLLSFLIFQLCNHTKQLQIYARDYVYIIYINEYVLLLEIKLLCCVPSNALHPDRGEFNFNRMIHKEAEKAG